MPSTERPQTPQVYKNDAGEWRCVDCSMWGGAGTYPAKCCGDMLEHLVKHQALGERLPEPEVNALLWEFYAAHRDQMPSGPTRS